MYFFPPLLPYLDSESVVHKKTKLSTMLTYSTIETKIGTWIDGKTIYRKIVKGSFNCEQTILTLKYDP